MKLSRFPEEAFQRQVLELAERCGWRRAHFRRVRVQHRDGTVYYETPVQADGKGFPDLIMCKGSVLLAWELKVPPNKATPEQLAWLEAFAAVGADAREMTPDDWDEIQRVLTGQCG